MFKFLANKALEWKMRDIPEAQREMIKAVMEQNPKLFESIAKEIEAKKKAGIAEQAASLQVFFAKKHEIAKALQAAAASQQK